MGDVSDNDSIIFRTGDVSVIVHWQGGAKRAELLLHHHRGDLHEDQAHEISWNALVKLLRAASDDRALFAGEFAQIAPGFAAPLRPEAVENFHHCLLDLRALVFEAFPRESR